MGIIMEEVSQPEVELMDEEDLQEKALLGTILIDKFEKEVTDAASHIEVGSERRASRLYDPRLLHDPDLTQSLLSGPSSKLPFQIVEEESDR